MNDELVVWWKGEGDGWSRWPHRVISPEHAEEVGEQLLDTGADEVMICVQGEHPSRVDIVLTEHIGGEP